MRIWLLGITLFALFCGSVLSSNEARAQTNTTTVKKVSVRKQPAEKPWNIELALETGSTLHRQGTYERKTETGFGIAPSYRFSENWSLAGNTAVLKDDSQEGNGNTAFDNTNVTLSYNRKLTPNLIWKMQAGGVLPTNPEMREQTSYQGAVKTGTGLTVDGLVLGSRIASGLVLTRNFHEYNIDADGGFNMRDSAGITLGGEVPLTEKFTFALNFTYSAGRAYSDDLRTKFSFEAGLSWAPTKQLNFGVGTSNTGSALQPNGRDSNIEFFDNNSSVVKMGMAYTL